MHVSLRERTLLQALQRCPTVFHALSQKRAISCGTRKYNGIPTQVIAIKRVYADEEGIVQDFQSPPRESHGSKKRRSIPGFGGNGVGGATVLGAKVSNAFNRMRASVSSGTGSSGTSAPGSYQ